MIISDGDRIGILSGNTVIILNRYDVTEHNISVEKEDIDICNTNGQRLVYPANTDKIIINLTIEATMDKVYQNSGIMTQDEMKKAVYNIPKYIPEEQNDMYVEKKKEKKKEK